jgi:iron-sulfur cluster assembly protein
MVDLTPTAVTEVRRLLAKENKPEFGLRLAVRGGGCSGLSYHMEFNAKREKDHEFQFGDIHVYVDPKSYLYLKGISLDFEEGLQGKGFQFRNPNANKTCGCGESFSV